MAKPLSGFRAVAAALLFLACAGRAHAQAVKLEFHDGQVNLTTQNASIRAILAEWARLGGTQVVNAERVSGAPLTLQLTNVPETQALDIILRGTAGYIAGLRAGATTPGPAGSALDRILVIPTAGTAAPAAVGRPAVTQPPFVRTTPLPQPPDPDDNPVSDVAPNDDLPPNRVARPGVPVNIPRGAQTPPQPVQPFQPQDDDAQPPQPANTPAPSNPFGISTGSSRPGTISPAPPPQQQRPQQRDPEP